MRFIGILLLVLVGNGFLSHYKRAKRKIELGDRRSLLRLRATTFGGVFASFVLIALVYAIIFGDRLY
jgi:hypothetical protein